jgi:hypothetical protein
MHYGRNFAKKKNHISVAVSNSYICKSGKMFNNMFSAEQQEYKHVVCNRGEVGQYWDSNSNMDDNWSHTTVIVPEL